MAKSIMIQGTMSNAGKSILVGGLCRIFAQDGYRTAPFKSQNMALNSFITEEGLEMGRAQVMQAEAAKTKPSVWMNPILLKPTRDTGSQVIVNGEVEGTMTAAEYYRRKKEYIPAIRNAYRQLEERYDIIVIEGAGSPAEINLKENDIVNMGLAEMVNAPVLLVGDIDRGGVFAQLVGTMTLLEPEERERVKGTIINKFRGDKEILKPGLRMLEEKCGRPTLGVVPYFYLDIDDEDSLTDRFYRKKTGTVLDIAVIRLPRISNFTDFMALEAVEQVAVRYISTPGEFGNPDAVIIPGSKNTIQDLLWMRQSGLEAKVIRHASSGKVVFGICGGYQMLGLSVEDPDGMEQKGRIRGMGLLPVNTIFREEKTRTRVQGKFQNMKGILEQMNGACIEGYEIHMGETWYDEKEKPILELCETTASENCGGYRPDGACSGNVYGCYVHGVFDHPQAAKAFITCLLTEKGIDPETVQEIDLANHKEEQYDRLADILRESLDMDAIYRIMEAV